MSLFDQKGNKNAQIWRICFLNYFESICHMFFKTSINKDLRIPE